MSTAAPDLRAPDARSLAERLFESVKRDIVEHRLEPDTILTEASLARGAAVSRAPAREALKRLAALGFVRALPRVGYIVTSVSTRDLDEIFALRLVLEPLAAELAVPRLTPVDLAKLEELAQRTLQVPSEPAHDKRGPLLAQLNAAFHREIARVAGNKHLERTIAGLIDELERVMHMLAYSSTVEEVLAEHSRLVETMKSGDPGAAARMMREQLAQDYEVLRELATRAHGASVITALRS